MSDHYLRLVSVDPNWSPSPEAAAAAVGILATLLPAADHVRAVGEAGVVFYDAGELAETIGCRRCGADLGDWWQGAMTQAFASGFTDLAIVTPCCGARTSLNDLDYVYPAAFGRFALEAANPAVADVTDEQKAVIEAALGTRLRTVFQHL